MESCLWRDFERGSTGICLNFNNKLFQLVNNQKKWVIFKKGLTKEF